MRVGRPRPSSWPGPPSRPPPWLLPLLLSLAPRPATSSSKPSEPLRIPGDVCYYPSPDRPATLFNRATLTEADECAEETVWNLTTVTGRYVLVNARNAWVTTVLRYLR
ncbi:t13.1 [Tupaiid betaherpesvirus 1]|uniref:T13.1 n=1 Tax=Tupaiid herpesvirus 1 (strain 1) TaxID=10397 RepID=Q91TU9_TUHV1|nr:t13.1 [Tupaiid betaherpesvirus 1]AAK57038.1 t13.1 [Tupaiid betaherpesvirus 1]